MQSKSNTASSNGRSIIDLPLDVKREWLDVIRHLQAACHGNKGYAVLNIKIAVKQNIPVLWLEADIDRIHPSKLAEVKMTPTIAAVITGLMDVD